MGLKINVLADEDMRREIIAFVREQIRPLLTEGMQAKITEALARIERRAEIAVTDAVQRLDWDRIMMRLITGDYRVRSALAPSIPIPDQAEISKIVAERVAQATDHKLSITINEIVDKAITARLRKII